MITRPPTTAAPTHSGVACGATEQTRFDELGETTVAGRLRPLGLGVTGEGTDAGADPC